MQTEDFDNSRIVDVTRDVDELVKCSTPILDETYVHKESISDIQDILDKSITPIPDGIDVSKDDTSDFEHVLVESSMSVQVVGYSLVIPMIEDRIEHETFDTSVVTSSKPYEFSCADCDYVVAPYFYSSSESVEFFTMVHQVTPNVFSFSECLKLFSDLGHIFIGRRDVIPLAV